MFWTVEPAYKAHRQLQCEKRMKLILPGIRQKIKALHSLTWRYRKIMPLLLFLLMIPVYYNSISAHFNTVYGYRCFFDSDGEFILHQFDMNKTFTHNDHLLYHVIARWRYTHAGLLPNPLKIHKQLSAIAGAAGVALLFAIGLSLTGRILPSLLAALFTGGCAGYWFFAATIDTYQPSLVFCILSLGFFIKALQRQRLADYAGMGAAMGMAFLFRTDAVLLGTLALIALAAARRRTAGLVVCGGLFLIVGVAGYAVLAHHYYNVPWHQIPAWTAGHANRPETLQGQWGTLHNFTGAALGITALNHALYAILIPGVNATRDAGFLSTPAGITALVIYILTAGTALLRGAWKSRQDRLVFCLLMAAVTWLVTRVFFYCWWDPKAPFLFAVLSLPAWWLILIMSIGRKTTSAPQPAAGSRWETLALALLTITAWSHNTINLVQPLRHL